MKKRSRIVSLLVCLTLLSGMMIAPARAADSLTVQGKQFKFYPQNPVFYPYYTGFNISHNDGAYTGHGNYMTYLTQDGGQTLQAVRYQVGPYALQNSLTVEMKPQMVYNDQYVKINYTVKNNGSAAQSFQLVTSAAVCFGSNNYTWMVGLPGGGRGIVMNDKKYTLNLLAPFCDTVWYGHDLKRDANMFNSNADNTVKTPYQCNSMSWSWKKTVKPGQSWSSYVLIGLGDLPAPTQVPNIPDLNSKELIAGGTVPVSGTAKAGDTVYLTVDGKEYSAVANGGNFSVNVSLPADYEGNTAKVTYWAVSPEGGVSQMREATLQVLHPAKVALSPTSTTVMEEQSLGEAWYQSFISSSLGTVSHTGVNTASLGTQTVTYTAKLSGFPDAKANLSVNVLPLPAELSQTTASQSGKNYTLSAKMPHTGGLNYTETGFVYGTFQNPNLDFCDGIAKTSSPVNAKNGALSATATGLLDGVTYYARAYAKTADGTVIYGPQSSGFGLNVPSYGTFKIRHKSGGTFTIYREGGTGGTQKVYYRTVNGSAVGDLDQNRYNFKHTDGVLTFADGEDSKDVTVTEFSNHAIYNGYVGTQYANADRTYQMEINKVEGGAIIDQNYRFATRNMGHDAAYTVRKSLYTSENERSVTVNNDNKWVSDSKPWRWHRVYFKNDRGYNAANGNKNFNVQRTIDVGTANENAYINATAAGYSYKIKVSMTEETNGYQNIWLSNHQPDSLEGKDEDAHGDNSSINLDFESFGHAFYTARWEANYQGKGSATGTFPSGSGLRVGQGGGKENYLYRADGSRVSGDWVTFNKDETAHAWFAATGNGDILWYVTSCTDYVKLRDTQEPKLIDVAYMARNASTTTYLPGDPITISLIFDEIVDKANSEAAGLKVDQSYVTLEGWKDTKFYYKGGAGTNILYFTATTPEDAPTGQSNLKVSSVNCAGQIKDMAGNACTGGTASSTAPVASNPAPTVTVGNITNNSGTLTSRITVSNADKLEYVWTTTPAAEGKAPAYGWKSLTNKSGDSVTTRQGSGTWYLYARAANVDGRTAIDKKSITIPSSGSGALVLPELTASVDNSNWARSRDITVTKTPSNATVTCTAKPAGATVTPSGGNFTVDRNGSYTFKLTSGSETVSRTVSVSKLDLTAPTVTIDALDNSKTYIEPVTLTVNVADSESGLSGAPTGTWNKSGGGSQSATFTKVSDGVYTSTCPVGTSGVETWTLTVNARDAVGNTGSATSPAYTMDYRVPVIAVNRQSQSSKGDVYKYTVTQGGSPIAFIQLPDGALTIDATGEVTLPEPGTYYIFASDEAGRVVRSEPMTVTGAVDGLAPVVRLYADTEWTNQDLTVEAGVSEKGSKPTAAVQGGTAFTLTASTQPDMAGFYEGSFTVGTNGTYTVTATDQNGNVGTAEITISNIDKTAPAIGEPTGNPTGWTKNDAAIAFSVSDAQSGMKTVTVKKGGADVAVTNNSGNCSFTATENGTYTVTATDNVGNTSTKTVSVTKIDKAEPTISVSGGTTAAASLELTVTADAPGGSGVTATVAKDGGAAETVTGGKYAVNTAGSYVFTAATGAGLTASQTVNVYNVNFAETGDSTVDSLIVAHGGKVAAPTVSKTGYTLSGWKNGENAWDFDASTVTADTILTAQWTITPAQAPTVTGPADAEVTYGYETGPILAVTATAGAGDAETLAYQWYSNTTDSATGGTAIDGATESNYTVPTGLSAGSYYYYCVVTATRTDNNETATATSDVATVTVDKAPSSVTAPTANTLTYNGTAQALVTAGSSQDGVIEYSLDGTTYSTAVPTAINAGNYTVYYKEKGDANHADTDPAQVPVTIAQVVLTPSVASVEGKTYDGKTDTTGTIALEGAVNSETPTATGTFAFETADAGEGKPVNVTNITLDNGVGANYALSTEELTATATIAPKDISAATVTLGDSLTYNGAEQTQAIASVVVDGLTVTYTVTGDKGTNAGDYTLTVTGNGNFTGSVDKGFTVARKPITGTVTISGKAFVEQILTAEYTVPGETMAYQWYRDGVAIDGATESTYTVVRDDLGKVITVTVSGTGNYTGDVTSTATDAVGKTLPAVTQWPTAGEITYGQALADSALTGGEVNVEGAFTWTDATIKPTVPDSGKTRYSVTFTPNDTDSYSSLTGTVTLTVHKADPVVTAPTANTLTYDGTAQALVVAGTTTGGEMQYSIDGGEYSAAIPIATDAKDYTVSYKVAGGDNYNDVPAASFTVAIARKPISGTVSISGTAKMDETLTANYTAAGETVTYQWYRGETAIDGATESTYKIGAADVGQTIKVTASGTGNYIGAVTAAATGTVGKTVPTITWPTATPITFGQSLSDSALKDGKSSAMGTFAWTDGTVKPAISDSNTTPYGVTFTPADLASYETVTGTVTVTVNRADPSVTAPTANTLTYTGTAQALVTAGSSPDGTIQYSLDGGAYSTDVPQATNAGRYTVSYKVSGDANHADTEPVEVSVTIAQVILTPSVTSVADKDYDGTATATGTIDLAGAVNNEEPTAKGTFTFENADAGEDKAVNVTGITLDDGWDVNYALSTEELTATATITAKDISTAAVTLGDSLTYTGEEQTQKIARVTVDGLNLLGDDYTVTGDRQTDADSYTLTVTGSGNFTGSVDVNFSIAKAGNSISNLACGDIIHGETPEPTADAEFGGIEYTYSRDENGPFAPWSSDGLTGTWYVKASVADTANYAGAEQVISFREAAQREADPTAEIEYPSETLTGLAAGADYIITPAGGTVITVKADENGGIKILEDWFGKDLSIVTKARDEDWSNSFPQDLTIPARPAAPAIQGVNETIDGEQDGQITGLGDGSDYQISDDDGGSWTDAAVTGGAITGLAPETYQVRLKATETSFAGVPATVTIATGEARTYTLNLTVPTFDAVAEGYDQPGAKALTITSAGNSDSTVSGVEADTAIFTIGGEGETVPAGGSIETWTIQPNAGLEPGVYTSDVTVTYNDDAAVTAQASFTVNEASPEIKIDYTAETLTGFEAGEKYTINDVEVTPADGTLPAGEYMSKTLSIVKKGDGTGTDSAPQELTIPTRPDAPTGPKAVHETILGKADGKITGIDETIQYKTGGDWQDGPADLEGLPAGSAVTVRSKATDSAFASQQRTLTVGRGRTITVTFDAQGGSPVPPALTGLVYRATATDPTTVPTKEGFTFCGWYAEPNCVNRWNFDRELTDDLTLYAKWAETTYSISGLVDESGNPVNGAEVRLVQGKVTLQTVNTVSDGTYRFDNVVPGDYNVVAAKDGKTITILVTLVDKSAEDQNLTMPADKVNSILKVEGDATPDVVVGGLDQEAKDNKVSGSTVTITMTVESKDENDAGISDQVTAIKEKAEESPELEYLEIDVKKKVETDGSATTETDITDTQELMEIIIPFDFTGKQNVKVYRYHGSGVDEITQAPNLDQEKIVLGKDRITLYVKKFSTYAIGYATVHAVTVQNDGHGTAGASPASAIAGAEITLNPSPNSGYRFKEWLVVSGGVTISGNQFTMPDVDVTVKAIFEYVGTSSGGGTTPGKPTIEQPEHGKIEITPSRPEKGDEVEITVTPDDGYEVEKVIVTDENGKPIAVTKNPDGTYTYTQPKGKVTISAELKKSDNTSYTACPKDRTCPIWPYTDASATAWYHDGVHYCIENDLMNGYGDDKFGPADTLTRGMLAQILYNKEGRPAVSGSSPFDDVTGDAWYAKAVIWGAQNGVLEGYGNGRFGPDDPITREQLAVMLYRYEQKYAGGGFTGMWMFLLDFADADQVSDWANEAIHWMTMNKVITGKGDKILDPKGQATRAEAAAMIQRFLTLK